MSVFWKYIHPIIEVILVNIIEQSFIARVILIVFIIGLIAKFLLN